MASPRSPHVLVIAAGYTLGAALYARLPEQIPPSWTVAGLDIVPGRAMVAFLLPTAAAVTYFLLRGLCVRHPVDAESSPQALATYDAVMLRFISFLMGVHAIMLVGLLGLLRGRGWAAQIVPALPGTSDDRDRQPPAAHAPQPGDRHPHIAHALRSDDVDAHAPDREYAAVGLGGVVLVGVLALPPPLGPATIMLAAPAAVLGVAVLVYRAREESCKLPQS